MDMKQLVIVVCLFAYLAGCTSSPDLNTPREVINDRKEIIGTAMSISVRQDDVQQMMELIKNRFRCEISEAGTVPTVRMRIELQNIQPEFMGVNSIYLRTDALPIDNTFHTLSGDPIEPDSDAVKLTFLGTSVPVIPSPTANIFRISLRRSETERRIYGLFTCTATVPSTSGTTEITGDFAITY
jgi:hypothetical protein